ncbi:MAG: hypothetical protein ABR525_10920 [Candidatus Limnocylindria bacterium]
MDEQETRDEQEPQPRVEDPEPPVKDLEPREQDSRDIKGGATVSWNRVRNPGGT